MKHYSPRQLLIISIIIFLLSVSLFVFVYKNIKTKQRENLALKEEWVNEATRRENAKSLANMLVALESERGELDKHFAYKSDLVPFLDTLERLARLSGNKGEISSVDLSKDGSGLLVNIKVTGSFESVYKYILLVENAPYEIEFINFEIKSVTAQEDKNNSSRGWSGFLELKLLSFIDKK